MPGLNRMGPDNMGPMTGRRMGRCFNPDGRQAFGFGPGYGRGRGCNQGLGLRNRGNAFRPEAQMPEAKDILTRRARDLEQELDAIRNELKNLSDE